MRLLKSRAFWDGFFDGFTAWTRLLFPTPKGGFRCPNCRSIGAKNWSWGPSMGCHVICMECGEQWGQTWMPTPQEEVEEAMQRAAQKKGNAQ